LFFSLSCFISFFKEKRKKIAKVKNLIRNIYKPKMSTPFEPNQGPIGVDNEISLLKHEQQPQNDQVMNLFLNQVADYNTFDHHQPQQGSSSSSSSNSGHSNNNNSNNSGNFF
jgi:hypothetical protein